MTPKMRPTKAEIETAEQLLENYILGKLPPDTTAEEYFAQALADARSQGIIEGLEMAAKIVSKYKEEPYTRDTGVEAENMEGEIRAQIEKEKQGEFK